MADGKVNWVNNAQRKARAMPPAVREPAEAESVSPLVRWRARCLAVGVLLAALAAAHGSQAADQPVAIFHAFDQPYRDVASYVCSLAPQGYSHVQIAPAQKSNPADRWWARYQPVDYSVIEGMGSVEDLGQLVSVAHGCGLKVIADVVFNHMANMQEYGDLDFPGIPAGSFHPQCAIDYGDGNRDSEVTCWLGGLPDLDHTRPGVLAAQKGHLQMLMDLGIDGFRFDAAKHMSPDTLGQLVPFINTQSGNAAWSYLEVIEDGDTSAEDYNSVAPVTDFVLYRSMKRAFSYGGDLRTLHVPSAVDDSQSVTFGRTHDNIHELNDQAIDPYDDRGDALLATTYVLAREGGTPLVLNWDNHDSAPVRAGVAFRRAMRDRARSGGNTKENVLAVIDSPTLLIMERGNEGFYVVNKAATELDVDALDMTLTNLEGCYRELRNGFTVAIERRDGKKWVTRWGTWRRGGMEVHARDALYFVRDRWSECQVMR